MRSRLNVVIGEVMHVDFYVKEIAYKGLINYRHFNNVEQFQRMLLSVNSK